MIIMICAPAKAGKDTLYPLFENAIKKRYTPSYCNKFAF